MLIIPFFKIFSVFFISQFLGTITYTQNSTKNFLLSASFAIPLSFSVFGLIWLLFLLGGNLENIVAREMITKNSINIALFILIFLKIISYTVSKIKFKNFLLDLWLALLAGLLGVIFQIVAPKYFVGDSYFLINWSASGLDLINRGFPLIGISLSNFSLYLLNDFYLNAFHNLMSVCLVASVIITIFLFQNKNAVGLNHKNVLYYLFPATFIILIFTINGMFFRHSIYVNFNLLAGFYVFVATAIFFVNRKKLTLLPLVLIFIFLSSLATTRFEGVLLSIIILWWIALYSDENKKITLLILSTSVFNTSYLCLIFVNTESGSFVSPDLMKGLIFIVCLFPLISFILLKALSKKILIKLTAIFTITIFVFLTLLSPSHMLNNLFFVLINLNPLFWGLFSILMLVFFIRLVRMLVFDKLKDFSIFGLIFFNSLIIMFCLTFFRESLRFGMNDSFNRMLIQIAPTLLPFASLELSRLIKYYDRRKTNINHS